MYYGQKMHLPTLIAMITDIKAPIRRYEYVTPEVVGLQKAVFPDYDDRFNYISADATDLNGEIYEGKRFKPGEKRDENWLMRPSSPVLTSVIRDPEMLTLNGSAFINPLKRIGTYALQDADFEVTVEADGKLCGYASHFLSPLTVFLPHHTKILKSF